MTAPDDATFRLLHEVRLRGVVELHETEAVTLLIDDGFPAAGTWEARMRSAEDLISRAETDNRAVALIPMSDALSGKIQLAFDHARIVRDAVERVRVDLELTGIATAFVGPTFTVAELRAVYEAVWGVHLDGANFRRRVVTESGWVIPTGRRARPGSTGGKPAELFRAGRMWKQGGPIRHPQSPEKGKGNQ